MTENQIFTDEELLKFIKENSLKLGITGYDIGKNTSISEQSAYKILDGRTLKPRRKNLLEILYYLEERNLGINLNQVAEPTEPYKEMSLSECLEKQINLYKENIELMKENARLRKLLEKK